MERGIGSLEHGSIGRNGSDRQPTLDADGFRTDAYAVIIGIDAYEDDAIPDLEYARADAEALHAVLTDVDLGRFQPDNVELLLDEGATREAIVTAIATRLPRKAREEDTVVIYFSGHGAPVLDQGRHSEDGFEKFLVPQDGKAENLRATGVDMTHIRQYFGYLDARQIFFFVDSCYSGGAGGRTFAQSSVRSRGALGEQFLESLGADGRIVMTACKPNEVSLESRDLGHGLFTYHLTEGLRGAADVSGEGIVSIRELYAYVHRRVASDARQMAGAMHPMLKGEIIGEPLLTQYETEAQKEARKLSEQASAAFDRRELRRAESLWTGALRADRRCEPAREGLVKIHLTNRLRKLLDLVRGGELTPREFEAAKDLLEEDLGALSKDRVTERVFLEALADGDIGVGTYRESIELLALQAATEEGTSAEERWHVGTVRIRAGRARLRTPQAESLLLVPYPKGASVDEAEQLAKGAKVFEHLRNRTARISGVREGDRIFSAKAAHEPLPDEQLDVSEGELADTLRDVFESESPKVARKLDAIGIRSTSAFYHRVKNLPAEVEAFALYLGVGESSIERFLDSMESESAHLIAAPPKVPVTRGVVKPGRRKARASVVGLPADAVTPDLPSYVDLGRHVTRVRNQGQMRGTSVAFAAVAAVEHDLIRKAQTAGEDYTGTRYNTTLDLSEQYLFWACKQADKAPHEDRTSIRYAAMVLRDGVTSMRLEPGVVREPVWRYDPDPIESNPGQGPPDDDVLNAPKLAIERARKLDAKSVRQLKETLHEGHCVVLSLYTYHFWADGYAWREGVISLPVRTPVDGAHAICLVGYQDDDDTHREGYFRFKNSWGQNWGVGRPDPGFGDLPYRYVVTEGIEAWSLEV